MTPIINIGIVYEPHPTELRELSNSLIELTTTEPEKEKIVGFAGPNEVVQLIVDAATWHNALWALAMIFGGKFAGSFSTEMGKLVAGEVWKNKKNYYEAVKQKTAVPFLRLFNAIQDLRSKDQTITIAVKIPGTPRNAGLVITSEDPAEIAWQLANVMRCADEITNIIMDARKNTTGLQYTIGDNPDMSLVIEVLENGDVKILDITIVK
jgi:hypothetical protein